MDSFHGLPGDQEILGQRGELLGEKEPEELLPREGVVLPPAQIQFFAPAGETLRGVAPFYQVENLHPLVRQKMLSQGGDEDSGNPLFRPLGGGGEGSQREEVVPLEVQTEGERGEGGEEVDQVAPGGELPRGEDQVGGGVTVEEKLLLQGLSRWGIVGGDGEKVAFQSSRRGKGKEEGGGGGEDYPGSGGGGEEGEKGLQPLLDMEEGRLAEPVGGVVEGGERGGTHGQVKEGKVPLQVPLKVFQGRGCDQEELLGNLPKEVGEEVGQAALGGSEEGDPLSLGEAIR